MKHVWILNHYAQGPEGSGGTRHFALSRYLPEYGWSASIIAASTDHNLGTQRLGSDAATASQTIDGVTFLWLRASDYSGNGADRVRNMLDYTYAALRHRSLRHLNPPDAIIGSSVHPFAAWAGSRLAKRYGVPFLFEVRDLWPQTLIDMGRISTWHPAAIGLRRLEKSLYRRAKRIIVLLPRAGDYIEPLGISADKIVWIPNGADLQTFPLAPPRPASDFTLMYFGAHGEANDLENVLQAMRIVHGRPEGARIRLRLIGQGPQKPALVSLAKAWELSNVRFEDPVPKSQVAQLASQADAFVFNLKSAAVFRFGISSNKLFDFMAAQRPVIFCSDASNNPIEDAAAGMTVPVSDPSALADAIIRLSTLPLERRIQMGSAARQHLEANYDMEKLAKRLAATLDTCVGTE